MEDDKLSIKVNVADRYYPLRIAIADEEKIRAAVKRINEKVTQYRQRYTERDVQDALSMAALQFVIKLIEQEEHTEVNPEIEELYSLDKQLEEYLKQLPA